MKIGGTLSKVTEKGGRLGSDFQNKCDKLNLKGMFEIAGSNHCGLCVREKKANGSIVLV